MPRIPPPGMPPRAAPAGGAPPAGGPPRPIPPIMPAKSGIFFICESVVNLIVSGLLFARSLTVTS
jgi:hypothetical protein